MSGAQWRIREWFKNYDERVYERLRIYHLELLRWTGKINLISNATAASADRIHFADSLKGLALIESKIKAAPNDEIFDFGSGNGFPGLVWAILRPDRRFTLIDSDERKVGFLKNMTLRLELDNVGARKARIEEIESGSVKFGVCRGLSQIHKILVDYGKVFSPGAQLFHFKGPDWASEIKSIPTALCSTWNTQLVNEYLLPPEDSAKPAPEKRSIVLSERI
ncbi:MAG: 16S rRNA (guanine(527)-N(7))-methyltransferase RsmG [Oligoflexia bacterium]|nr:16S rRNA (guanine(527)-N(7))-methyltransferase RsmG [Oligoflexia bacterium]